MSRLPAAPLTPEDAAIVHHGYPWSDENPCPDPGKSYWWGLLWGNSERLSPQDEQLMLWLTWFRERYYGRSPLLPVEAQLPIAHLMIRGDPEWPAGHIGLSFV